MPAAIENNQMAYVGSRPWHGLGINLTNVDLQKMLVELQKTNPKATITDVWLNAASLNWEVHKRALAMRPLLENGEVDKSRMLTAPLEGFQAVVRGDNDHVFQIASDRYEIVQNYQVVDFFREYCEAGNASLETVGALRDGAVIWALAKLDAKSGLIGPNSAIESLRDIVEAYMLLATSHDGTLVTIGQPTQVRVVCQNTLRAAINKKDKHTFKLRHSTDFEKKKEEAKEVMGMAIEQIESTNEVANRLSKVKVDDKGRLQFIAQVIGNNGSYLDTIVQNQSISLLDSIVDSHGKDEEKELSRVGKLVLDSIVNSPGSNLPSAKDTLWGCINGVTHYADHVAKSRTDDARLYSAWFGVNDGLKDKALTVARQMAG